MLMRGVWPSSTKQKLNTVGFLIILGSVRFYNCKNMKLKDAQMFDHCPDMS
jgi:hypothetical protein